MYMRGYGLLTRTWFPFAIRLHRQRRKRTFPFMLTGAVCLIVGAIIGGLAAWLLSDRKSRLALGALQTQEALASQRGADLLQQLDAEKAQTQSLRDTLAQAQGDLAAARTQFQAAQQNLLEQRKSLDDAQVQLRHAFASVSADALARNNEAFLQLARERFATISAEAAGSLDQRKEQIEGLLKPMRELMDQYQIRVGEIEKSRVESYSMLREQLGTLAEAQRTLNTQTSQLVTALSRPTVRGQWGEISLRRIVELAGMTARCDFFEQQSLQTEQGRQRPDVVVRMPDERSVVIDCKACLDAFLDAASAADEDMRRTHLQRHSQQVRSRARDLAGKSYWAQFPRSPEFVVMFLPGEAFLYAAVEYAPDLIDDCIKNRVLIATPTTLIALLKTIEFGWRQQQMAENAEQIRGLGSDLYDRIATVLGHISKMGASLSTTVDHYNGMLGSLEGRLLSTARKMSELGARSDKPIASTSAIDRQPREVSGALFAAKP
jgi:DNA recombination protein RmuC